MKNVKPALIVAVVAVVFGLFFFIYLILPKTSGSPKSPPQSTSSQNLNPQQASIKIKGFAFKPASLHINRSSTVTWTNADDSPHMVVDDAGGFSSTTLVRGGTFSYTFSGSGTYTYHCSKHPSEKGTITVD